MIRRKMSVLKLQQLKTTDLVGTADRQESSVGSHTRMEGSQESQDAGSAESAPGFGTVKSFLILIFAACHK